MKSFLRFLFLSMLVCELVYAAGEITASAQPLVAEQPLAEPLPDAVQPPAAAAQPAQTSVVATPAQVNQSTGIVPADMVQAGDQPAAPAAPVPEVTPEVKPADTAAASSAAPETPAESKPTESVAVQPAAPAADTAPVIAQTDEKPVAAGPAPALTTSEAPSAEREKEVIAQTIEDLASRAKVLSPAPEITEQTQPSKELQDQHQQLAPASVAVDDKKFVAEKMQLDLELVPPECVPSTLDTTDVESGGNWVIKRAFWEQAERTYEKVMQANNAIYEQHIAFVKMRNEIDDIGDKAFKDLGFEQGQLDATLTRMLNEIKVQRDMGTLNEQERQLLQSLKDKQQELEQLKLNLQAIDGLDNALDEAMLKLNQQVTACRQYEKQSWDHFKAIGRELNDKKARILFYEMEGFFRTVEKNREYISGQLKQYFDETINQIKTKLDELRTKLGELKQKGTDIGAELDRFAKADREKEQQALGMEKTKLEQERAELDRQQAAMQAQPIHKGWFVRVKEATTRVTDYALDLVMRGFSWVKHLVGIK